MNSSNDSLNKPEKAPLLTIILAFLVIVSPLLHFSALRNPDLPRYPLLAATAGLGLLAFALDLWHGRQGLLWHYLLTIIVAFFAWAILSAAWAQDPANYAIEITQLTGLVLISILAVQISNKNNTMLFLSLATISASIVAVLGLWQNYGFNPLSLREGTVMASTFYSKNHAAMYFDFILPAVFILVLLAKPPAIQWLTATGLALCGAYILSARCRGSWVGLTITLLVLPLIGKMVLPPEELWGSIKERRVPLFLATVFSVTIFLLPGQKNSALSHVATTGHVLDTSSEVRLQLYQNALPMIADNPLLGTGLGSFRQAYRPYMHSKIDITGNKEDIYIDRLHNEPLQYFVEIGLIGGLLALAIYLAALRTGIVVMHSSNDRVQRLLSLALTLGLVANGTHSLFDFPYHKPSSAIQFWLSIGLLVGMSTSQGTSRSVTIKKTYSAAVMVIALIFLGHNADFYFRYLCGNYHTLLATQYFNAKKCTEAILHIDQAEQKFSNYWGTHAIRTRIYSACERAPERLLDVMNEELTYEPTNARALLTRADLYGNYGFSDLARDDYTRVTKLFPKRGSAYLGLAHLALKEDRTSEAITMLDRAILNEPKLRAALTLRAKLRDKTLPSVLPR